MALNFLLKRSGTADKRPDPAAMALGELDLNYDDITGGIFYKNASGSVVKVGPAQVSAGAPNGTPSGSAGNSAGEFWYDTANAELKIFDGTSWVTTGVSGITNTAFTAAGNILVGTGLNTFTSLAVGADGQVLIADSGEASGVRWGDLPAASTTGSGIVQLNDTVTSTSTTEAATANAVKTAYDAAAAAQTDATQALADASAAAGDVGDLSTLTTTDKSSAVAAINEVNAAAGSAQTDATQALADASAAQSTADLAIPCADITAKGDILAGTAASTPTALSVGTNGQVLSANSACATGLEWVQGGTALPTGGTDGQFLVVDNNCPDGLTWADNPTQPTETSAVCTVAPYQPPVGTALEGGYFGGYISTTADGVADYALIVSPKASGQFCGRWWWCCLENTPTEIFNNQVYGKPATDCGASCSGMYIFRCVNALTIGGCTDWYVPAVYEMDILYKNLKPDVPTSSFTCCISNSPFAGCNPYSVPPQNENYCLPNVPGQTTATAFRRNQSEAFFSCRYWTATQYNPYTVYACVLDFNDGDCNQVHKTNGYFARAIRRVPASAVGSGEVLSFPDAQGLTALSVGDTISQDTTCASGTITCIDLVNNQVIVDSVTGTFQDGYAIPLTPGYIPFPTDSSTDDQVLTACAACDGGVTWTTPAYIPCAEITAKGDLLAGSAASTPTALPVGADGQFLVADSGSSTGLAWADNPTSATETATVSSVNPILPSGGTALCGGYYAGSIDDNGTCVALIIAPKDVGQIRSGNGAQQDWLPTTISRSTTNGALITECFRSGVLTSGSFLFETAFNLNACGYSDWYVPARCEMLRVVENLGRVWTTSTLFKSGGSQVMDCNSYSTATESSTTSVWTQSSVSCGLTTGQQLKSNGSDVRLIRREPISAVSSGTALTFPDTQGFDSLEVGCTVTQPTTGASGTITNINTGTCTITFGSVTGTFDTGSSLLVSGGFVPNPVATPVDGQILTASSASSGGTSWASALPQVAAPSASTDAGNEGEIASDASYFYMYTGGRWQRTGWDGTAW